MLPQERRAALAAIPNREDAILFACRRNGRRSRAHGLNRSPDGHGDANGPEWLLSAIRSHPLERLRMSVAMTIALVLALAVGLSLGALGGGGAVLTLPILVYVAGVSVREAVAISLVIVGGTSLVAFGARLRHGHVHAKAAALFAVTGMAASYVGSSLTDAVSERVLLLIFAVLMLAVGVAMLRDRPERPATAQCRTLPCIAVGTVVGALTGFLGVGGGFLIVPALVLFAGVETQIAIGTSLAVIAINAGAGLVGHLRHAALDWPLTLAFLASSLAGMAMGVRIARRVSAAALRRAFAGLVVALGLTIAALAAAGVPLP
jgi:uncharacterized membrane protein YfcA